MKASEIKRYEKKTIQELIKLATKYFNDFIRLRDSEKGWFQCISCGKHKEKYLMHAGHYLSAGHHGMVRFDERNVNGQCSACNTHLHGNLIGYRQGLEKKIGLVQVAELEMKARMSFKWDRWSLIETILNYQLKIKNGKDTFITRNDEPNTGSGGKPKLFAGDSQ